MEAALAAGRLLRRHGRPTAGAHERDDLTSVLLQAEIDGDRLTDDEIIAFLFLMVVAGNETTTKLLGNAWYWAWRHPDQRAKPLADPARVPDWVEETLRYDTSTQMLLRVTTPAGRAARASTSTTGERVLLLVGSANRDEDVFADPDRYDLDRDTAEPGQLRQRPALLHGRRPGPPGGAGRPDRAGRRGCATTRSTPTGMRAGALHQRPRASPPCPPR